LDEEKTLADTVTEIREAYHCDQHNVPCYVNNNRHIKLTAAHLNMWAKEIVCIFLLLVHFVHFVNVFLSFYAIEGLWRRIT